MSCSTCGAPLQPGVRFCSKCGAPVSTAEPTPPGDSWQPLPPGPAAYPPPPQTPYGAPGFIPLAPLVPRVQRHLQTLAILWIAYGVYRVFAVLIGVFVMRAFTWRQWGSFGGWPRMPFGSDWLTPLIPILVTASLLALALALFTGWSLLNRKPWGRVLAIIAAIPALFKFPVGTALAIYTFWVLAPRDSGVEYEAMENTR